ncbi:hypothetical protein, partial [Paenibacillus alba]
MKYNSLDDLLQNVKLRLYKAKGLDYFFRSLTIGIAFACLWLLSGRFFLISGYRYGAIISVGAALVIGTAWLFLQRPKIIDAAKLLDQHGLDDRISTALLSTRQTSIVAALQRQDALDQANGFVEQRLKTVVEFSVPRRRWIPVAAGLMLVGGLLILPNSNDAALLHVKKDKQWIEDERKQVGELVKELAAKPSPLPVTKQMTEDLKELEKRLSQTLTTAKALEELEKSLKKMEAAIGELEKQQRHAEQWAESMQRTEALRELGESLAQKSAESVQREAAKLAEQVQKMTPQQKQQLASELERLAASAAAGSPDAEQQLREQLQQAASALRSGEDAAEQLSELQAGLAAASAAQQALAQQQAQAAG